MKNQKGQSMIEFALVMPIFMLIALAMVYGGILFMDYLQFSNSAQAIARQISITQDPTSRQTLADDFKNHTGEYFKQLTNLYQANANIAYNANNVTVIINLKLDAKDLPPIFEAISFPPENLKPIEVIMPMAKPPTTTQAGG